jgi:hypothetical protein
MTDVTPTGSDAEGAALPGGPGEDAGLAAEHERLARQLRDARMQLAMAQARLSALEGSASMRFGRTFAMAARKPWPRGAQLPRDLYRLWRERGIGPSGSQNVATALASAQLTDLAGTGERFLSSLTAPGALTLSDPALTLAGSAVSAGRIPSSLVIAGAVSTLGAATLAPDAVVHVLLPHDADVVLEGTGADLVLIEAAALLPGSPWAYATDPAASDRGRRLARMIVMAHSLGKPVVLVRNVPHSRMPGLSWLVPAVDAVVDADLGVQLARFNPIGAAPARPADPVYAGGRDPREAPALRALLDALTGDTGDSADSAAGPAVRLAGARSWRALPALYQSHAVFAAPSASSGAGLEQQASGARVVSLAGHGASGAAEVREQLAAARAAGPLTDDGIRAGLREIFATHATPVRLAAVARSVGLQAGLVGGRQASVLARVADSAAAGRLAAVLLRQRLAPAEVIVAASPSIASGVREALNGLADHGVRVVVTDDGVTNVTDGAAAAADWARPLARLATAAWVAPWPADGTDGTGTSPDTYLLDLVCARECAQADAVGFGAASYAFTRSLGAATPALVRRDLLALDAPPAAAWGEHGLRLFTVTRA